MKFGGYLRQLRENRELKQSDLSEAIGVSPVYVCDIEKDRRYPPDLKKLNVWVDLLKLTPVERARLFDLAGQARSGIAPDISAYLDGNPSAREAIRRIMGQQREYDWNMVLPDREVF